MAGKAADLNDEIVLIEGADPGYDWISTTRFVGLITALTLIWLSDVR